METQLPPPKMAQQPLALFGPCLLWPNGHPSQLLLSTCTKGYKSFRIVQRRRQLALYLDLHEHTTPRPDNCNHRYQMLFTIYCQMRRISCQTAQKIPMRYGMHFSAILSNSNIMVAYICRRFIPTTAFLVWFRSVLRGVSVLAAWADKKLRPKCHQDIFFRQTFR